MLANNGPTPSLIKSTTSSNFSSINFQDSVSPIESNVSFETNSSISKYLHLKTEAV